MAPEFSQRYPALTTSPRRARRDIAEYLCALHLEPLVPVAALLVSELVTNSVLHAGGPIELHAQCSEELLHVDVDDPSEQLPRRRVPDHSGRGLHIVGALAEHWGVLSHDGHGKSTWFELRLA